MTLVTTKTKVALVKEIAGSEFCFPHAGERHVQKAICLGVYSGVIQLCATLLS